MFQFTDYQAFKAYLFLHQNITDMDEAQVVIRELESEKNNWDKAHRVSKVDDCYPQIFLTIADACFIIQDYDKSIEYLNQVIDLMESNTNYKYYFEYKECAYRLLARNYCYKKDIDKALKYMKLSAFNNLKIFTNTHYDGFEFYSFRSVSKYSVQDLNDETLSLSDPSDFNDPVDSAFFPWLGLKINDLHNEGKENEERFYNVMYEAYSNVRARCFVRKKHLPERESVEEQDEVCNTLMWAHYTDYHKGFCVKYRFPSSFTMDDNPDKLLKIGEIHYVESLSYDKYLTFNEAFFTKSKAWEYENEKRIFYFDKNGSPEYITVPLPKQSIEAVYIGLKCSDEDKRKICNALEDKPWVKIYQMVLSRDDIYKIKPLEINISDIIPSGMSQRCCLSSCWKCIKKKFKLLFKKI